MKRALLVLWVVGCGVPPEWSGGPGRSVPTAQGRTVDVPWRHPALPVAVPLPASCNSLPPLVSEADFAARVDALVATLQQTRPGTHADTSGLDSFISGLQLSLGNPADPVAAAVHALQAADPALFADVEVRQTVNGGDLLTVLLDRRGTTFRRPAFELTLLLQPSQWILNSFSIEGGSALASAADLAALAACVPTAPPPPDAVWATPLTGLSFHYCAPGPQYSYLPSPPDALAVRRVLGWERASSPGWHFASLTILTIDPSHFWPDFNSADCSCGAHPGFMLELDTLTGEVLTYTPGIDCVVC